MAEPASSELELLFVYGSLKREQANAGQLARATFVADARTVPCFALRILDGYPALVPGAQAVCGELYRIARAELSQLDDFEGDAYLRETITLADGRRAFAYVARAQAAGMPHVSDRWPPR